ncbi:helix-turn-helix transcriptional regulator [Flavobacterium sp. LaA7.5]|nr:helix-turn-helix transcriptional regulator [Flavobacterium salilacus subsp. altitudinum]
MDYQSVYITPDIKLSCYNKGFYSEDIMFEQHMLVWFMSGVTKIIMTDGSYVFKGGDIFLLPRNRLATIINTPQGNEPHKSVVMHLTSQKLKEFYKGKTVEGNSLTINKIYKFSNHPLLTSCLTSLIPYFELGKKLPEEIADIKIGEAIAVIRLLDNNIDSLLANFEEPGKVDLTDFMEKHFMFNMPLDKFGYLTGRSTTTFRRDFKKAFSVTPQKWLTQKRLELAHYQITEKQRKPSEVYIETGFENFSHFSYAFKKKFGYSPAKARL